MKNTKRQTVWLVSMLSLMVILSAYYLFTEDLDSQKSAMDPAYLDNASQVSNMEGQDESNYTISELDHEVLAQLEADGYFASNIFNEILTNREQQYLDEENRIMSVIADVSAEGEDSLQAVAELEQLEVKNAKKSALESQLMEQYEMALVSEEQNEKYKVVVASDSLERKEAAQIIQQVITTLEVRPDQVSVQFVPAP